MRTCLYRYFDSSGALLYVGVSLSAVVRASQHKDHSSWFSKADRMTFVWFENREDALSAERAAVCDEQPLHNIRLKKERKTETEFERHEIARSAITHRVVTLKPLYKLSDAAALLLMTPGALRQLIQKGEISACLLSNAERKNKFGQPIMVQKYVLTGWQIIEYLEHKETETQMSTHQQAAE